MPYDREGGPRGRRHGGSGSSQRRPWRSHDGAPIEIEPEAPSDRDAIRRVHEAAFERPDEADIVDRLRGGERFVPAWSLVAHTDAAVVGHALFSYVDLAKRIGAVDPTPSGPPETLMETRIVALGPIGVLPSHQGMGVGRALIEAGIGRLVGAAEPAIAVLGDPELYGRFGFVPAATFGVEPTWAAMMILDLGGAERWRGGTIVYPPEFSAPSEASEA